MTNSIQASIAEAFWAAAGATPGLFVVFGPCAAARPQLPLPRARAAPPAPAGVPSDEVRRRLGAAALPPSHVDVTEAWATANRYHRRARHLPFITSLARNETRIVC